MRERPLQPWRWQLASSWLLALLALAGLWAAVSLGRTPAATAAPNTPNVPIADWCATGDFNNWNNNGVLGSIIPLLQLLQALQNRNQE